MASIIIGLFKIQSQAQQIGEDFENIKFKDARSLDYLKKIVSLRTKAEIYSPLKVNYRSQSSGINAEVLFGKTD